MEDFVCLLGAPDNGQTLDDGHTRLKQHVLVVNEVLRHFWASVPCSSALQELKAKRMTDELQTQQQAIANLISACTNWQALLSSTAQPVLQALQTATNRFQAEQARRAQAHRSKLLHE